MDTGKINTSQMFCLMVMFELGSAVVVGVGLDAKQDAWMAILFGMAGGLGLYSLYQILLRPYPDLPLTSVIPRILGRILGVPVSAAYILYFFYIAARVLRDFGELLITSVLGDTPLIAINALMILVVMYAIFRGIEGIGRTGQPVFAAMMVSLFLGMIFLMLSTKVKPERLLPVLEQGMMPVMKTVVTQTYTFPFGEMIAFTMLLPMLNDRHKGWATGVKAILLAGILLAATIALDIAVLGVKQASRSQFALLETFSKVNVGEFVQRLDILVVSTLILGMFIKITVFFYAGFTGLISALPVRNQSQRAALILGLGTLVLFSSVMMGGSFAQHIETGLKWIPTHMHWPVQTLFPLLLLGIAYSRRGLQQKGTP